MDKLIINVDGGPLPRYATPGSSGADLFANLEEEITIKPDNWGLIPTGIRVQIPAGFEGQVRPRSGLALKYGIGLLNAPGTIDSDYRGEIKVILYNFGKENFIVHNGDRIAQLVVTAVYKAEFVPARLDGTERSAGGFGHTGS